MADNKLEIIIGADVKGAITGIAAVDKGLKTIPASATKASASLSKLGKDSGSATLALGNLGRVAQDAPFGFIGISNNLNPLLESFQRLKAESGSTGGALKSLAGSLVGAGGIGLALSAITAAVTFAQIGFRAWGGSAEKAKEKISDAKKETETFNEAVRGARSGAISYGVSITSLIAIYNDENTSSEKRKKVLKEINESLGKYGKTVSDVDVASGLAAKTVADLTKALVAQAVAAKLSDKIADLYLKQADAITKVAEATKKVNEEQEKVDKNKANAASSGSVGGVGGSGIQRFVSGEKLNQATKESIKVAGEYRDVTKELQQVYKLLNAEQFESVELGDRVKKVTEKSGKSFSDFVDKLKLDLQGLSDKQSGDPFAEITKGTAELLRQFQKLKSDGKLTAQDIIDGPSIIDAINKVKVELLNQKLFEAEQKASAKHSAEIWGAAYKRGLEIALSNIVPAVPEIDAKAANESLKTALAGIEAQLNGFGILTTSQLAAFSEQFTSAVKDLAANAAAAIGEGIGSALAGQKNPFSALIGVLGNGLKALGKIYIQIGTEMLIAQKAIKAIANNPYLTIIAGIALTALGQLLQSKAQSQTKLAEGGIVSGPLNAQIGEAGQSEVILPLSRLAGLFGSGGGGVITTRVAGQDLLLILNRAQGSQNRTFR